MFFSLELICQVKSLVVVAKERDTWVGGPARFFPNVGGGTLSSSIEYSHLSRCLWYWSRAVRRPFLMDSIQGIGHSLFQGTELVMRSNSNESSLRKYRQRKRDPDVSTRRVMGEPHGMSYALA